MPNTAETSQAYHPTAHRHYCKRCRANYKTCGPTLGGLTIEQQSWVNELAEMWDDVSFEIKSDQMGVMARINELLGKLDALSELIFFDEDYEGKGYCLAPEDINCPHHND